MILDNQTFAVVKGKSINKLFVGSDFKAPPGAAGRVFTPGQWFEIARLSSGLEVQNTIKPNIACDVYLFAQARVTMSGALAAGPFVIDLAALGFRIQRSKLSSPAFPTARHADAHAFAYTGAAKARGTITAIDYNLNTVTVDRAAGVTAIDLRFLNGDGEFSFRANRPTGSDTAAPQLGKYAFRTIHGADQKNTEEAFRFQFLAELPPRWNVILEVNTKAPMPFDEDAEHILTLPGMVTPVVALDKSRYDATAELALRGGRL